MAENKVKTEVEETDETKVRGNGNLGLPFGLCAKFGIALPKGATPRDAWKRNVC